MTARTLQGMAHVRQRRGYRLCRDRWLRKDGLTVILQ